VPENLVGAYMRDGANVAFQPSHSSVRPYMVTSS
jgi:hypothetical protein